MPDEKPKLSPGERFDEIFGWVAVVVILLVVATCFGMMALMGKVK